MNPVIIPIALFAGIITVVCGFAARRIHENYMRTAMYEHVEYRENHRNSFNDNDYYGEDFYQPNPKPKVNTTRRRTQNKCADCKKVMKDEEEIVNLECGHPHHKKCFDDWVEAGGKCVECFNF